MLLSYVKKKKKKKKKENDSSKVSKDRTHAPRETEGEGGEDEERMIELRSSCSTYRSTRLETSFFHDFIVKREKEKKKKKTLRRR